MQAELLDRRCKPRLFEIPTNWEVAMSGVAKRGDRYWNWGTESWVTVEDSHTFLGIPASKLQCLIRRTTEGAPCKP